MVNGILDFTAEQVDLKDPVDERTSAQILLERIIEVFGQLKKSFFKRRKLGQSELISAGLSCFEVLADFSQRRFDNGWVVIDFRQSVGLLLSLSCHQLK